MLIRHFLAIAVLPFVVAVVVPLWLARHDDLHRALAHSLPGQLGQFAGLCLLLIGVSLFFHSLRRFAAEGEGTLAPWDPPRRLVLRGPYRYVRNPMISGVLFVLCGEALVLLSVGLAQWALAFLLINLLYIPLVEEPQLKRRFGEPYLEYCRHVPRVLPRLRPWIPAAPSDNRYP